MIFLFAMITIFTSFAFAQTPVPPEFGNGSVENPYQIATLANLHWIAADNTRWDYHYIQTADIDASSTAGWGGGAGWTPIGNELYEEFTGSYNGQGHIIDGLHHKITTPTPYHALFGRIDGAKIEWLGVTNVDITGYSYAGGLVGYSTASSTINNCYTTGEVAGRLDIGGLVGNSHSSIISNCYSTCSVTEDTTLYYAGYFSGGGLVGYNWQADIYNCYATGFVTNKGDRDGGLVGWCFYGAVENSFYDIQTTGQNDPPQVGVGKTTAEMKDVATYTNLSTVGLTSPWDFVNNPYNDTSNYDYWDIDSLHTINDGYPFIVYDTTTSVKKLGTTLPDEFSLSQNYPNPFNPTTTISFDISKSGFTILKVYDVLGKEIETLVNEKLSAGSYEFDWNASSFGSGAYFYPLKAGEFVETRKMLLIK